MSRSVVRSDEFATPIANAVGLRAGLDHRQDPRLQLDALEKVGVDRIHTDHSSGAATARPQLDDMLRNARRGDTVVVWRLDRLGRSTKHLLELTADLEARGHRVTFAERAD